jgi:hypothetical protein
LQVMDDVKVIVVTNRPMIPVMQLTVKTTRKMK